LAGDRTRAREQLERGKELYRNDQDAEAVLAFMEAVRLDPDLPEAHFRLALGYESLDKREEAEAEYKKAARTYKKYLEENDGDSETHYNLGQIYANLGQYSEAIREYRAATKLKEDDPDIYYDLGVAHTKLAQYDAARRPEASARFSEEEGRSGAEESGARFAVADSEELAWLPTHHHHTFRRARWRHLIRVVIENSRS
jgi:Flp pilus assembly protein TadD